MTFSMNEVEAMAKKAARGAGYHWGMAEEAGKATRWLCARRVDGCLVIAGLLQQMDGVAFAQIKPVLGKDEWTVNGDALCPITTGAALSDMAHVIGNRDLHLANVLQPLLLMPFLASVAKECGCIVQASCGTNQATTDGNELTVDGEFPGAAGVTISTVKSRPEASPREMRVSPHPDIWRTLTEFAHRTYAPATEESRMKGAGAGLSDND